MKNVIHPGYVISRNDGDRHFVSYGQLIHLYGLDPRTCTLAKGYMKFGPEDIHYYPREDGNYDGPTVPSA